MKPENIFQRYQELQNYVGWTAEDPGLVQGLLDMVRPHLPLLVEDFYEEIDRHPQARKVITGGLPQLERLRGTLTKWLLDLFTGPYDQDYVARRWQVGWRHVEIGLEQVYTNAALSRLRLGMGRVMEKNWQGEPGKLTRTLQALNKLLDLDLAIIEDAYQTEYLEKLQRSERLAAIGQVAGGVAHELRNPLNVVKTSIYYLLNARNASPAKQAEHLQRIEKQVNLADGVITALSNFAKLPVPAINPFDLAACVREALDLQPIPPGVEVMVDCPPTLSRALGDKAQIGIVLANLLRNACEAMPKGGHLTVTGTAGANQRVELAVIDTGVGIAAKDLLQIMEPLYSTKARGLGLGLALARSILEKNHGSMRVQSEPGQGSTFVIQLPAEVEG